MLGYPGPASPARARLLTNTSLLSSAIPDRRRDRVDKGQNQRGQYILQLATPQPSRTEPGAVPTGPSPGDPMGSGAPRTGSTGHLRHLEPLGSQLISRTLDKQEGRPGPPPGPSGEPGLQVRGGLSWHPTRAGFRPVVPSPTSSTPSALQSAPPPHDRSRPAAQPVYRKTDATKPSLPSPMSPGRLRSL